MARSGVKRKSTMGFFIGLAVVLLLYAALLLLSRATLWGWGLGLALFLGFFWLRRAVPLGFWGRFFSWMALFVLMALVLRAAEPPVRRVPAVDGKSSGLTGIVHVADGDVQGVATADGRVEVYAGIPYAAPPVGENRWREPQPVEPWEGVRLCDSFAPMSMQQRNPVIVDSLTQLIGYHSFTPRLLGNSREPVSEDSLYLNIWKPAGAQEGLPVLFFIHGGSLMTGQTWFGDYRGESFASEGVIVVNFAYRLGVFGYYASEELAAESPHGTTGDYGLLDQLAALRWVHDNIAAFGGDPGNITIAGESAGASSVNALCVSPLSEGLFRRAIAESSGLTAIRPYHTFRTMEAALEMGKNILAEFDCSSVQELREIPAERLVGTSYSNNSMTVDGYALTEQPYLSYEKGLNHEEALLNGFNGREAEVFNLTLRVTQDSYEPTVRRLFGDETRKVLALYPEPTKENVNEILSACWFAYSHHDWSKRLSAQGKPVYEYYFTRQNGGIGDWHSGEMIYAYGNLSRAAKNYSEEDFALSALMQSYWLNFIKTGDVNGEGLPLWPDYSASPDRPLHFDAEPVTVSDPYLPLYPLIDAWQQTQK